jgi:hypothetical protein
MTVADKGVLPGGRRRISITPMARKLVDSKINILGRHNRSMNVIRDVPVALVARTAW